MAQATASGRAMALRQNLGAWWFLLPAVLFFVGYQVYPIIRVIWISFTDFEFLSDEPAKWVGLGNYIAAINDPLMWASLWRAALFTIMFLPGTIILPLLLAVLVDRVTQPRLATVYRVVLLIPAVIPSTLVFVLWKWMYNYQVGPINHFLVDILGLFTVYDAPQWLGGTPLTPGLGFRFHQPEKTGPIPPPDFAPQGPIPVGLDGLFEAYCPPYYRSMADAAQAIYDAKWGPGGIYRDSPCPLKNRQTLDL
jgi:hypothetical protein